MPAGAEAWDRVSPGAKTRPLLTMEMGCDHVLGVSGQGSVSSMGAVPVSSLWVGFSEHANWLMSIVQSKLFTEASSGFLIREKPNICNGTLSASG